MIIVLLVFLSIISLCLLLWQISNITSVFYGTPYVMMDKKITREALKLAKLKKSEVFYDLGCGNGDVLIEAVKMGAKAVGYEISPFYYLLAKMRTAKYHNIQISFKNIYSIDLSKADVIYCYLLPKMLDELTLKFKNELKKEARLISVGFPIKNLDSEKKIAIGRRKIYIYTTL